MKKQKEYTILYAYYDIRDKMTYMISEDDDRILGFSGIDILENYNFDKKKNYIVFSNMIYFLAQLYSKNSIEIGKHRITDESTTVEASELINTYYKNVEFRNFNRFSAGQEFDYILKTYDCGTEVEAMRFFIRSLGKPEKVRWSLARVSMQRLLEPIKDTLVYERKKNNNIYYTKEAYDTAMIANKSGLLSRAQLIAYNVHCFDLQSAYPSVMVNDDGFPIGKTVTAKIKTFDRLYTQIRKRLDKKEWFKIVFDGGIEGFYDFYDRDKKKTGMSIDNIRETMIDKRYDRLIENLKNLIESGVEIILETNNKTGYLAKEFRDSIIALYNDKKILDKDSFERFYKKRMINCIYGKGVQEYYFESLSEIKRHFKYGNTYLTPEQSLHCLDKIRLYLKTAIVNNNTVYYDTDGIKVINEDCMDFFEKFNEMILKKNIAAGYDSDIGTWDYEGMFDELIVYGAKCYITISGNEKNITWAGMSAKRKELNIKYNDLEKSITIDRIYPKLNYETKTVELMEPPPKIIRLGEVEIITNENFN